MSNTIHIKGLRGTIYKRGKDSYRVQLSLGRNAEGKYDVKRETTGAPSRMRLTFLPVGMLNTWTTLSLK